MLLMMLRDFSSGLWSPPGGRFKKEVLVDGQSHLLLIREEAGPPDAQVRVGAKPSLRTLPDISLSSSSSHPSSLSLHHLLLCLSISSSLPSFLLILPAVQQLGGCCPPGLQPGERGQLPGVVPAVQPA